MRFHFMLFMFVKLCLRYRISKKGSHKMKDEKKLFEDLEIDILELDDVEGVPATAATSGSGGSSTCGSTSCSSCSSSCA